MTSLVGLDLETTGIDAHKHRIMQVGLALSTSDVFVSDVGMSGEDFDNAEPRALEVNWFTRERALAAPQVAVVDQLMIDWLDTRKIWGSRALTPVGWNVASFDMAFFNISFPRTSKRLHYRTVELNALCTALELAGKGKYWDLKDGANAYAAIQVAGKPHTADWDSAASLASLEYLIEKVNS